jgi:2-methylisocitrate lyase-like PEP mutase family enzyme
MNNTDLFFQLHHQQEPLLIANVWNAQSAMIYEQLGFKAIATSSAAVAEANGYKDGEQIPFDEYLYVIKRIIASTKIPLSVDMETGFGDTNEEVVDNLVQLHKLGVAGINIEDSRIENGKRKIHDVAWFADKLSVITRSLKSKNIRMFINVRCDTFILGLNDALAEATRRMNIYEQTGVDGIFLPCITSVADIKAAVSSTKLPLHVLCMPDLPDFKTLENAGVRRISMGDFAYAYLYKELGNVSRQILADGNFSALFPKK